MGDIPDEETAISAIRALLRAGGAGAVQSALERACAAVDSTEGAEDEDDGDDAAECEEEGTSDEEEDHADDADDSPDVSGQPMSAIAMTSEPARKRARTMKEDALGPRPPLATHWRCRRIEDDGRKPILLYHDAGDGIATCEWPIKLCSPETIRERWGAAGGSFVVQFIQSDEKGLRRPCGRSRMLVISPPRTSPREKDEPSVVAPPAPMPLPMPAAPAQDSFAQMFSLLAYMQDRDEKVRTAAREEARLANERYKADIELMMERDRLASKERIAQIEATARAAGRGVGLGAALDPELLAQRIGEVVGAKLDELYDDEDAPAAPVANPAPAAPPPDPDALARILEMLKPIVETAGPLLATKLIHGNPPPTGAPSGGTSALTE